MLKQKHVNIIHVIKEMLVQIVFKLRWSLMFAYEIVLETRSLKSDLFDCLDKALNRFRTHVTSAMSSTCTHKYVI